MLPAIKFVVDSRVYQLNVSGVARELVTGRKSAGRCWQSEGLIQSNEVVLKSRRPISRERPFDSDAAGKAPVAVARGNGGGAASIVRLGLFDPTQAPPPLP